MRLEVDELELVKCDRNVRLSRWSAAYGGGNCSGGTLIWDDKMSIRASRGAAYELARVEADAAINLLIYL